MSSTTTKFDGYQIVTDRIVAALEAGTQPWRKPWTDTTPAVMSKPLRENGVAYTGINTVNLWLAAQSRGLSNPYWLTWNKIQEMGATVRKGARTELAFFVGKYTPKDDAAESEEDARTVSFLRSYRVFNASEVDDLPAKYAAAGVPVRPVDHERPDIAEWIAATGAMIRHGGNRAFYAPALDAITLPPYGAFDPAAQYYATACHELVHWTAAPDRLARDCDKVRPFGSAGYAAEELVAELGAAFLCADHGLANLTEDQSAAYLAGWLKTLKNDKRAIFKAATLAEAAAKYLHEAAAGNAPKPAGGRPAAPEPVEPAPAALRVHVPTVRAPATEPAASEPAAPGKLVRAWRAVWGRWARPVEPGYPVTVEPVTVEPVTVEPVTVEPVTVEPVPVTTVTTVSEPEPIAAPKPKRQRQPKPAAAPAAKPAFVAPDMDAATPFVIAKGKLYRHGADWQHATRADDDTPVWFHAPRERWGNSDIGYIRRLGSVERVQVARFDVRRHVAPAAPIAPTPEPAPAAPPAAKGKGRRKAATTPAAAPEPAPAAAPAAPEPAAARYSCRVQVKHETRHNLSAVATVYVVADSPEEACRQARQRVAQRRGVIAVVGARLVGKPVQCSGPVTITVPAASPGAPEPAAPEPEEPAAAPAAKPEGKGRRKASPPRLPGGKLANFGTLPAGPATTAKGRTSTGSGLFHAERAARIEAAGRVASLPQVKITGYGAFAHNLDIAREAARQRHGERWQFVPGASHWATVPARWVACKVFGRVSRSPRDLRIPDARFWPGHFYPEGMIVAPDAPLETGPIVFGNGPAYRDSYRGKMAELGWTFSEPAGWTYTAPAAKPAAGKRRPAAANDTAGVGMAA